MGPTGAVRRRAGRLAGPVPRAGRGDAEAGVPLGPASLADGRDLAPGGLSFSHADPLACRFVAVSFRGDGEPGSVETVVARLLWCRFTRAGRYVTGGRIVADLDPEFGRPLATLLG